MLQLESLSKSFAPNVAALADVSLDVTPGELVALVGSSGCGKTTLLRLVAGLDSPTRGAVALDGEPIRAPHPAIGVVFQEPRLLPWLNIAQNVGFGLMDRSAAERENRVDAALLRVGLAGYGGRWPRELSGGQAQRVSIIRALVTEPKVLLMDEPFSALDALTRASLHDHLIGLWEAQRPTLLLVTHDVEEAVALADRAIVMQPRPGRVFADIALDLPRPRDRLSPAFTEAKRVILAALDGSLEAPSPRQKTKHAGGGWW
jgi:sulfonate transport system ATP-binding protein